MRHKFIKSKKQDFPTGLLYSIWDAGSGWVCVLMVGLAAGAVAGVIDISARWMSDLKVCSSRRCMPNHCHVLGRNLRGSLLARSRALLLVSERQRLQGQRLQLVDDLAGDAALLRQDFRLWPAGFLLLRGMVG